MYSNTIEINRSLKEGVLNNMFVTLLDDSLIIVKSQKYHKTVQIIEYDLHKSEVVNEQLSHLSQEEGS